MEGRTGYYVHSEEKVREQRQFRRSIEESSNTKTLHTLRSDSTQSASEWTMRIMREMAREKGRKVDGYSNQ